MFKRRLINYARVFAGGIVLVFLVIKVILPGLALDMLPSRYKKGTYKGRIKIYYWEKWTGFEGEAMQALVDQYNRSQDRVWVEKQTISRIDQRFLVSVAGKNPPDVAGLQAFMIPNFAAKGALLPLDDLAREYGVKKEDYLPIFWELGRYNGHLYALPTTPVTLALHYNKRLFREAGLDPEKPPQTLEELDDMAQKLTSYDKDGKIKVIGFTPSYPGWYHWAWGFWFGGRLWDGVDKITIDHPGNVEAFLWIQNYARKYGVEKLQTFQSGFGNFASAQNPFLSEQVAMEIQGVWMYNFIDKYNPELEWGATPFPSPGGERYNCSLADCDDLVIPRDAPHPREAFEFIRFVQQQKNMEFLCMGQRKFSPLWKVSDEFWANHPHPYIKLFYDMAKSFNIYAQPMIPVFQEIRDELNAAFYEVWLLEKTPEQALKTVQKRIDRSWADEIKRMKQRQNLTTKMMENDP